jgi:hypothetical protein
VVELDFAISLRVWGVGVFSERRGLRLSKYITSSRFTSRRSYILRESMSLSLETPTPPTPKAADFGVGRADKDS